MRHVLLLLCLGCGPVLSSRFPLRRYFYVDIEKTWDEARAYCRQKHSDLAIFSSVEEAQLALKPAGFSSSSAWIGIHDDPQNWKGNMTDKANSWKWSATGRGSQSGYQNFKLPGEPNFYAGLETCIIMNPTEDKWRDIQCKASRYSVCFKETDTGPSYTYVNMSKSWSAAVDYCRQHYTDLAMIEDVAQNQVVFNSKPGQEVWIGLSRNPWTWADGSSLTFNNWIVGRTLNVGGSEHCVAENDDHQWMTAQCQDLKPFLCHEVDKFP
uniref:C-type lectin domain-containing protein n=1 Tax=Knipowitschia caucasica TaxID=637954 RepID=A0AAV2J6T9_KNICA